MLQRRENPVPKQRQLLIVEDEVMVAWAHVLAVRELGWQVCATVTTEQAAVEAALHFKPDAILMDYRLGQGGDGLLAARRIRESTDTPIIFCTAYGNSVAAQLLSLQRTQLVRKPVQPFSLQKALQAVVEVETDGREQ